MKFMFFVLPTVPATLEERKRLRPIGRNNDRYQMMLDELRKLAVLADDAGAHQATRTSVSRPTRLMAPGQHWHQDGSPHHSRMLPVLQHQAIANGSTLHRVAIMAFWRSAMNRRVEAMSQERGHGRPVKCRARTSSSASFSTASGPPSAAASA
jgi:hypothetical protein